MLVYQRVTVGLHRVNISIVRWVYISNSFLGGIQMV